MNDWNWDFVDVQNLYIGLFELIFFSSDVIEGIGKDFIIF